MRFWQRHELLPVIIDLGSKNTKVMFRGKLLFAEPTLVAKDLNTDEILAIGNRAAKLGLNSKIELVAPFKHGGLVNRQGAIDLITFLIKSLKLQGLPLPKEAKWAGIISAGANQAQIDWLKEIWHQVGGDQRWLLPQEVALAAYAWKKHHAANINLVDVGQSITRVIMIEDKKIVLSQVLPWGMEQLTTALDKFLVGQNILVGNAGLERIVEELISLNPETKKQLVLPVRMGINQEPRNLRIGSKQLLKTVMQSAALLSSLLEDFIILLPPALQEIVQRNGLLLVGGGANLDYLATYLANNLKILVKKGDEATYANLLGLEEWFNLKNSS